MERFVNMFPNDQELGAAIREHYRKVNIIKENYAEYFYIEYDYFSLSPKKPIPIEIKTHLEDLGFKKYNDGDDEEESIEAWCLEIKI